MADRVVSSSNHDLVIDPEGKVWSRGANRFFQLGYETSGYSDEPRIIPGLPPIVSVSAGRDRSLFLNQNGEVWGVGYNIPQAGQNSQVVQRIYIPGTVISISAGANHVLFLNSDGEVFGYGLKTSLGQLASPNPGNPVAPQNLVDDNVISATLLEFDGFVTAISAGNEHSLILDNQGRPWYVGYEDMGHVYGAPADDPNDYALWGRFRVIHNLPPIKAISAGDDHDLFLTEDGRVFFEGILDGENVFHDQQINMTDTKLTDIREIHAGNLLDLAVSEDGELFVISRSRLSNDEFDPQIFPLDLEFNVRTASGNSTNNTMLLVDEDSRVWRLNLDYDFFNDTEPEFSVLPFFDLVARDPQLEYEDEEPYLSFDLIDRLLKDERFSDYRVRSTFEDDVTLIEFELKTGEIYLGWVKYNPAIDKLSPPDHEISSFEHLTQLAKDGFPEHEFLPNLYSDERGNQALKYRDDDGTENIIIVNVENGSIYPALPLD